VSPDDAIRVLAPAAVGAAAGAGLAWLLRGGRIPWGAVGAVGAPVGLAAAVVAMRGWPSFPPANANDWPVWLALPALAAGLAAGLPWRAFAPIALAAIGLVVPAALIVPLRQWTAGEAAWWLPVFAMPWLALVLGSRLAATTVPTAILPAWAATLAVAAVTAVLGHSASVGLFLGGAAVAAAVLAVARLVMGEALAVAGPAVSLAVLAPVWWVLAHTLADVPVTAVAALAVAPAGAWVALPWRDRPWAAVLGATVGAAILAGVAAWLTWRVA
jgi:hypothetical protein